MQRQLHKMTQVAAYWRRQQNEADSLMLQTHLELRAKHAFAKWKNLTFLNKPRSQAFRPEALSQASHPQILKREQNLYDNSIKQTLDWLYTFDKAQKPGASVSSQGVRTQTLEHAKHAYAPSGSSSIQQFDDFLSQIQKKSQATPMKSVATQQHGAQ